MTNPTPSLSAVAGPPTKHQLALMIWLAVFPTLTCSTWPSVTGSARLRRLCARSCSPQSRCRSSSTG